MVAVQLQDDLRRVLDDEGKVLSGVKVPEISDEDLLRIFDRMILVRVVDDRMMRLQRQGRLGFYMKSIGEEASHFAVYALRDSDWVYPSYREQGAWFWRGYSVENFVNQLFGNENDPVKGRQMPVHHSADWLNMVSISSPVGTQIPQAVGTAMAQKISGTDGCTMTYFGEGTSSEGDFHVALNFAGVLKAPAIFILRNNGWAISTPSHRTTAAKSYASRAMGYGMPGIQVDGNDILAVIQVAREAVERARSGEGPTLIEAKTYRIEGHSSSDDPSAYRADSEPAIWEKKDPLKRLRGYLKVKGLWSEAAEKDIVDKYNDEVTAAVDKANTLGEPPIESIFEDVYENEPWHLAEQRQYLMSQARTKSPHSH
jgi:2-oxoisovalerate dehydrogenase E1 component alpha subunit